MSRAVLCFVAAGACFVMHLIVAWLEGRLRERSRGLAFVLRMLYIVLCMASIAFVGAGIALLALGIA